MLTVMFEMTGGFPAVKLKLDDDAAVPAELADVTAKSYMVFSTKPVNVMEWLVTSEEFSATDP